MKPTATANWLPLSLVREVQSVNRQCMDDRRFEHARQLKATGETRAAYQEFVALADASGDRLDKAKRFFTPNCVSRTFVMLQVPVSCPLAPRTRSYDASLARLISRFRKAAIHKGCPRSRGVLMVRQEKTAALEVWLARLNPYGPAHTLFFVGSLEYALKMHVMCRISPGRTNAT
jgi:hypothetical protein